MSKSLSFAPILLSEQELPAKREEIEQFYSQKVKLHSFMHDGLEITAAELNPQSHEYPPLVIVPGRGENRHKYAELLFSLNRLDLRVIICLSRGQGDSQRLLADHQKCHINRFDELRFDVAFMLSELKVQDFYLLAFSMGALISLDLIKNGPVRPLKAALIAPYLWPVVKYSRRTLKLAAYVLGTLPFTRYRYTPRGREYRRVPFEENYHSHCRERYSAYHDYYAEHPQLTTGSPTYGFIREATRKQEELMGGHFELGLPVYVQLAGADKVVSSPAAAHFFEQHSRDSFPPRVTEVPGCYHDVLNEIDEYRNPMLESALRFLYEGEE